MFYNVPIVGVPGYNPGTGLTYKTIDALELMFSTPGAPAYWTRYQNRCIYCAVATEYLLFIYAVSDTASV